MEITKRYSPTDDMSDHLQRAYQLMVLQKFKAAEDDLAKAIGIDPAEPFAHAWLALCRLQRGDHHGADEAARQAVAVGPEVGYAHFVMAITLAEYGRPRPAVQAVDEAIRLDPSNSDCFVLRGKIQTRLEKFREALADADAALALDPAHIDGLNLRADVLRSLGRQAEAEATMAAAMEIDPSAANSHIAKGRLALDRRAANEAVSHFQEALRLDPNNDAARTGLIEALHSRGSFMASLLSHRAKMEATLARAAIAEQTAADKSLSRAERRAAWEAGPDSNEENGAMVVQFVVGFVAIPICNFLFQFSRSGRLLLTARERLYATCTACYVLWWFATLGASIVLRSDPLFAECLFAALLFPSLPLAFACRGRHAVFAGFVFAAAWVATFLTPWTMKSSLRPEATWEPKVEGWSIGAWAISLLLTAIAAFLSTRRR